MARFGPEFRNLAEERVLRAVATEAGGNSIRLESAAATGYASNLYIAPQRFRLSTDGLPQSRHRRPNGEPYRELVIPERHTLWFARGAAFALEPGVLLVIRGRIRAEATGIFELPDVEALRNDRVSIWPDPPDPAPGQAAVRIESTRMDSIRPEWFGARSVDGVSGIAVNNAPAVTRALQACIHAACRDRTRDGLSLPPLNVILRGIYCVNDTLVAFPDENGRGALWLRGDGDASTRGLHIPALIRFARGARPSGMPQDRLRAETVDSALLRVHPAVSLEASGIGFRCHGLENGELTERDVSHTVLIEDSAPSGSRTPWRHVYLDRCGLTGGRHAIIAVRPYRAPPVILGVLLPTPVRVDPTTVDPAVLAPSAVGTTAGMVEIAPMTAASATRVQASRSQRVSIRDCSLDALFVPEIRDGQDRRILFRSRSSQYAFDVAASAGTDIELTGGKVVQTYADPVEFLDLRAGLRVRGASAFIRSVAFHLGEGPRPSRWTARGEPDGQDLWLDTDGGVASAHVTVLHVESQSWWFLGGRPIDGRDPGAVCLLNVGAGDVNLAPLVTSGAIRSNLHRDPEQSRRLFTPPSVAWPGQGVPFLMEACRFRRYVTFAGPSMGGFTAERVVNVGSSFFTPLSVTAATWYPSSVMPGPSDVDGALSGGAAAGHPVPTSDRFNVRVIELPVRFRWS